MGRYGWGNSHYNKGSFHARSSSRQCKKCGSRQHYTNACDTRCKKCGGAHFTTKCTTACYKCGGAHYANRCTTVCYECGGSHYVTKCPRRAAVASGASVARSSASSSSTGLSARASTSTNASTVIDAVASTSTNATSSASASASTSNRPAKKIKSAWWSLTVPKLKAECKKRGLKVTSKMLKADIVKILEDDVASTSGTGAPTTAAVALTSAARAGARHDDVAALFEIDPAAEDSKPPASAAYVAPPFTTPAHGGGAAAITLSNSHVGAVTTKTPDILSAASVTTSPYAKKAPPPTVSQNFSQGSQTSINFSVGKPAPTNEHLIAIMSQESTGSSGVGKKPELTEDQKERKRRNREEALRKRQEAERKKREAAAARGPTTNPYLQARKFPASTARDDDGRPFDNATFRSPDPFSKFDKSRSLDELPPLPPDAPPVRKQTLEKLSEQQMEVVMAARPPTPDKPLGTTETSGVESVKDRKDYHMVRVNAAAGTGKTTTLIHLATRCIDLGHDSLTYVTYSRASAKDAQERMRAALDENHRHKVSASTIHSCAMRLLGQEPLDADAGEEMRDKAVLDDNAFLAMIKRHWSEAIDDYIEQAAGSLHATLAASDNESMMARFSGMKDRLFDKAAFYIFKTFMGFVIAKMTPVQLKDEKNEWRHYFPVKKHDGDFSADGAATKLGFPSNIYAQESSYKFFADTAAEVWDYVVKHGIRTYAIEMKKAQLKALRIPAHTLLVDECQDLDECQVAWIESQKLFGTHIYFVGDAAQCIYGFRKAKSSNVMKLECFDMNLTRSWRFGPNIARIANILLFAKEKSLQTAACFGGSRPGDRAPLWTPYRVQGARRAVEGKEEEGGVVTTKSLLANWQQYKPLALIGMSNSNMMMKALEVLGLESLKKPTDDEAGNDAKGGGEKVEDIPSVDVDKIPKFHINGKGDASGLKKWTTAAKQIGHLYELFMNQDEAGFLPMNLPAHEFKEFVKTGPVTWITFNEICHDNEISTYDTARQIISTYDRTTPKVLDILKTHVLGEKWSEDEADIILTTGHSAKGLEWDHVEICDDLLDLSATSFGECGRHGMRHPSFLRPMPGVTDSGWTPSLGVPKAEKRKLWQFMLSSFKDGDINLLYVAMTRARKTLSVPKSIKMLLQDFDRLHDIVETYKRDSSTEGGGEGPSSSDNSIFMGKEKNFLSKGQVWDLYHDLVLPLRKEICVSEDIKLLQYLFPECRDEPLDKPTEERDVMDQVIPEDRGAQAHGKDVYDLFACDV